MDKVSAKQALTTKGGQSRRKRASFIEDRRRKQEGKLFFF
jgi:hypothetical protein